MKWFVLVWAIGWLFVLFMSLIVGETEYGKST